VQETCTHGLMSGGRKRTVHGNRASPRLYNLTGASGLRIGESSSVRKPFGEAEELPDADRV